VFSVSDIEGLREAWASIPEVLRGRVVPLSDGKRCFVKGWSSRPWMSEDAFDLFRRNVGVRVPEEGFSRVWPGGDEKAPDKALHVCGYGLRTGYFQENGGGCLIAVDIDCKHEGALSEDRAGQVLRAIEAAVGEEEGGLVRRVRSGSPSCAVLLWVEGLGAHPKEVFHFERADGQGKKDAVELLGDGQYLACCYFHEEAHARVGWENNKPPLAHRLTVEGFNALKLELSRLPGVSLEAKKEKAKAGRVGRPKKEAAKVEAPRGALEKFCSSASEDPVWCAVRSSGLLKEEKADGVLRIACPWGPHTGDIPQKSEYYWHGYRGKARGFHCFADQCDGGGHSVGDLIGWLEASGHLARGWRGRLSAKTQALLVDQGGACAEALPDGFLDGDLYGVPGWIVFEHRDRFGASVVPLVRVPFASQGWVIGEDVARRAVLRGVNGLGEEKKWIIPVELDAKKLWDELVSKGGLPVGAHDERAAKKLHELVCALSDRAGYRVATRHAGWQFKQWEQEIPFNREVDGDPVCVLNDGTVIGGDAKRAPVLIPDELIRVRKEGTVQSWREEVAPLVKGQSKGLVALSVPFYAILARLMGWTGGALFLVGPSGTGKSTFLKVAASVDGVPVEGSDATANFNSSKLMANFDIASTCDDLKKMGKAIKDYGFMFNGDSRGRQRATVDGVKSEKKRQGCPVVIGTSEKSFVELHLELTGSAPLLGEEVRVLSMNAVDRFGAFTTLEPVEKLEAWGALSEARKRKTDRGAFLAKALTAASINNVGAVGRAFRGWVAGNLEECAQKVEDVASEFVEMASSYVESEQGARPNGTGVRVLTRLGRHAAALVVANDALSLGLGNAFDVAGPIVEEAAKHIIELSMYGDKGSEVERIRAAADEFFQVNAGSFVEARAYAVGVEEPEMKKDRAFREELGIFFESYGKSGACYYVQTGQLEALCKRLKTSRGHFLDAMRKTGALFDEGKRAKIGGRALKRGFFLRAHPSGGLMFSGEEEES